MISDSTFFKTLTVLIVLFMVFSVYYVYRTDPVRWQEFMDSITASSMRIVNAVDRVANGE